jgi:hypothetical protein
MVPGQSSLLFSQWLMNIDLVGYLCNKEDHTLQHVVLSDEIGLSPFLLILVPWLLLVWRFERHQDEDNLDTHGYAFVLIFSHGPWEYNWLRKITGYIFFRIWIEILVQLFTYLECLFVRNFKNRRRLNFQEVKLSTMQYLRHLGELFLCIIFGTVWWLKLRLKLWQGVIILVLCSLRKIKVLTCAVDTLIRAITLFVNMLNAQVLEHASEFLGRNVNSNLKILEIGKILENITNMASLIRI